MILKKAFLTGFLFILMFSALGCSQKDRLGANTMTLSIEPNQILQSM
jgi:hypothetical protein